MKKLNLMLLCAAAIVSLGSCNKDMPEQIIPDSEKEMISFSLSDGTDTKAGFTGGDTRILMRIQSDDRHSTPGATKYTRLLANATKNDSTEESAFSSVSINVDPRYWDDAYGRYAQLSVYAIAIADKNAEALLPFSMMYDGEGSKSNATNIKWGSETNSDNNTISFTVTTDAQTKATIADQDLVYSNNIQKDEALGKNGVYRYDFTSSKYPDPTGLAASHANGRMIFAQKNVLATAQPTDAPGKFDKGHLIFNHALSRLTITLVKGDGFIESNPFAFASGTNIKLLGMNTTGTFDVKTGSWTPGTAAPINKMAPAADNYTSAAGTYSAQMLPGYVFDSTSTNVMEFTIDNNTYYVTKSMIFNALKANAGTGEGKNGLSTEATSYTMEKGKNYKISITVKKTGIDALSATLVKWVDINGSFEIDNSHITVTTKKLTGDQGSACCEFNLFRYGQVLDKIYTDDSYTANTFSGNYKVGGIATKSETSSNSNIWNTNWYYEDNKTAYHFRTLNNIAADGSHTNADDTSENVTNTTGETPTSYFTMTSGAIATQDYHWGAPLISNADLKYDETASNGFKNNIHKGIVAPKNSTANTINITEFHMMSNIYVKLITDSTAVTPATEPVTYTIGPAAVNLKDATITLTRFAKNATVDMGTGYINPAYTAPEGDSHSTSDSDCADITKPDFSSWESSSKAHTGRYTYAVVPQALRRSDATTPAEKDCVGLTITTSDNNQYYVIKDLAAITASSVSDSRNQTASQAIKRWYPGHRYYYTIKITKKGIEAVTCTVANWVDVTANDIPINLES